MRVAFADQSLEARYWEPRHRVLTGVLGAWIALIAVASARSGDSAAELLLLACPMLAAGAAAWTRRLGVRVRGGALALALTLAAAAAGLLSNADWLALTGYVVVVALVALYEDRVLLALTLAAAATQQVLLGAVAPEEAPTQLVTLVHLAALAGFAVIISAPWPTNARTRRQLAAGLAFKEQLLVASQIVVGLDRAGKITMLNGHGERLLGHAEADAVGRDWVDLVVVADEAPAARANLVRLLGAGELAGGFVDFEHAIATVNGRRVFRWRASLDSTAATRCVASGIDITDQRAAQQQLVRDQHDLTQLVAIAQAVARNADARPAVVDGICELAEATSGGLCELDPTGEALVVTYSTSPEYIGVRFELAGQLSGVAAAFSSGKPFFVPEAEGHPLIKQQLVQATGLRSLLYEPVFVGDKIAGVLTIGWSEPVSELGGRQTNLVALAAGEAASAIERVHAMRHWQDAALTDSLTGLPNRRAFEQQLDRVLADAASRGASAAIAAMDLNAFKALNDSQGHEAGDRVLKETAGVWLAELRPTDLLARIGGDEFVAILPGYTPDHVDPLARRLRRAVRHSAGAGVGIAVWDGMESAAELLGRADQALYADKARGAQHLADPARIRAARATGLTSAPHDPQLQALTVSVAEMLDVPIATLSILTDEQQYLVGQTGLGEDLEDARQIEVCDSYCRFPASTGRELIVEDTTKSPLLADNPNTTAMGLRAYAGIPIKLDGHTIGVLGVVATEPHHWTDEQLATLRLAAKHATRHLTTRTAGNQACEPG